MIHDFILIFLPLLVVIDPAGTLPLFLALTEHYSLAGRRAIARRATIVAAVTGVAFLAVGQTVFAILGVRFYDFQIAGGILLVVLCILDLLTPGKPAVNEAQIRAMGDHPDPSVGIVPLAVPLIVGPATMTTTLLLVATYGPKYRLLYGANLGSAVIVAMVAAALVLNLLILFVAMDHSDVVVKLIGKPALSVINKVVMILLSAIAVSLIRRGVTGIVRSLIAAKRG